MHTYDAKTGTKLATTAVHVPGNASPAIRGDGLRIASVGAIDRTLRVWDTTTGQPLFACEGHIGMPRAVAFSPDGKRIATVADDGILKLWDGVTGRETMTLRFPGAILSAVGFSPNGSKLVVIDQQGVAHIRDAGTPE
jgi:WD40 repeat protein